MTQLSLVMSGYQITLCQSSCPQSGAGYGDVSIMMDWWWVTLDTGPASSICDTGACHIPHSHPHPHHWHMTREISVDLWGILTKKTAPFLSICCRSHLRVWGHMIRRCRCQMWWTENWKQQSSQNQKSSELICGEERAKCLQVGRKESSYIQFLNCSLVSDQIFI